MTKTKKAKPLALLLGLGLILAALLLTVLLFPRKAPQSPAIPTGHTTVALDTSSETALPPPTGNVFTPMDFSWEGDYLTCITAPSVRGIDVSTHQKQIDYTQVAQAGFEFVMIRIGYRGSVQGLLFEDEWAQTNYRAAKEAGLKVGGYFFSQSISPEEAAEEARYAMEIISDWQLDMPLVYDWEYLQADYRNANVDARTLTDCTKAFCQTVEAAGYKAMIYFNPYQSHKQMYLEELTDYGFWLAMYTDQMDYPYKVDMWQYTCQGQVPGVNGNVDINLFFPYEPQ